MTDEEKKELEKKEQEEKAQKEKEAQEQKLVAEIQDGIKAIREKSEATEKSVLNQETVQKEIKETILKVTTAIDKVEVEQKRLASLANSKVEKSPEFKAFLDWMRKATPIPDEFKVMKLSDATLGGYLSTPEISNELLKDVVEFSPIRTIARVRTTGKESVKIRKRTGVFTAAWTGEVETKTETTGLKYGMEEIPTHELYAMVDISNWDLEDPDFNLENELRMEFSEQFGVAEGIAFVSGNAVKKPEGFMVNAAVLVNHVASGIADAISADGLKTLYFAPKGIYAKSGKFVMNRATMLAISILKDGMGNYLLRQMGEAPTWNIMGSQVVEAKDMANISAGTFPVAFGDFTKGYTIVDRIALAILRDPYSAATTNSVRFHARKRLGGQVVQAEAIWLLEIAAS